MTDVPAIFDRVARRQHRDRAARKHFLDLEVYIAETLVDRLSMVSRGFGSALVINSGHGVLAAQLRERGIHVTETDYGTHFDAAQCDEHASAGLGAKYDLVIGAAGLETIDDLPGVLIVARRALQPGGLFLGALFGAPSLPSLKAAMAAAEANADRHIARFHPEIDVRTAGDLLPRAGFTLPVADLETQTLGYTSLDRLLDDLRATGATNVLARRYSLGRSALNHARQVFHDMTGPDGLTLERVSLIVMTGWSPEAP